MRQKPAVQLSLIDHESAEFQRQSCHFDGSRLRAARDLQCLTMKNLAGQVGVTASQVSQFESGKTVPSDHVIAALERFFDVSAGYFVPGRPTSRISADALFFRAPSKTPASTRRQALEVARLTWEVAESIRRYVEFPQPDLPGFLDEVAWPTPEIAAQELRAHWGLGRGPVQHVVRHAEARGVFVINLPSRYYSKSMDAFSYRDPEVPVVVLVPMRPGGSGYRRRFTMAHELGHLVMHSEVSGSDAATEREADRFAAEFLVPTESIRGELPKRMDLKTLQVLSERWQVSLEALIYRCREVNGLSESSVRRAFMKVAVMRSKGQLHEPGVSELAGEQPVLLDRALQMTEDLGGGVGEIASYLGRSTNVVREIAGSTGARPALRIVSNQE